MSIDKEDLYNIAGSTNRYLTVEGLDEIQIKKKLNTYMFLGEKDKHIINLIHWIDHLEQFKDEVRFTDMDKGLEKEIHNIQLRLMQELGVRITNIFP